MTEWGACCGPKSPGPWQHFFVDLPFKAAEKPETVDSLPTTHVAPVGGYDFTGVRILVVEDHVLNRQLLLALLNKVNANVIVATQDEEALDLLAHAEEPFDLIMMDIQMPVMDGIAATRHIRLDQHFSTLPIIAVTANAMSDERLACFDAGMQDYLIKPLDRKTLYECIAKYAH